MSWVGTTCLCQPGPFQESSFSESFFRADSNNSGCMQEEEGGVDSLLALKKPWQMHFEKVQRTRLGCQLGGLVTKTSQVGSLVVETAFASHTRRQNEVFAVHLDANRVAVSDPAVRITM